MTPLDVALHDEAARIYARDELEERHREAAHMKHVHDGEEVICTCQTCGVTNMLLRSKLSSLGERPEDIRRVNVRPWDCRSASYPYVASVMVDGKEIYRILQRPDEVFAKDVLADIRSALRRPM